MTRPRLDRLRLVRRAVPALLVLGVAAAARAQTTLEELVRHRPADSLVVPLRRFENEARRPADGARAAMLLGQLYYARGEYRPAAEAFSRAAARLDPAHKPEARYWMGLAWLALGDAGQARAVFEELAQQETPLRTEARLGMALAFEQAHRPDKAFEILEPLAREARGEVAPAVLERTIEVAGALNHADVASAARQRLLRDYPRSIEAARAGLMPPRAVTPVVELGPFPSEPRAHAVAEEARRAGFSTARALIREEGAARLYVVQVDGFADADLARHAADRAKRELAVPARVVAAP